MIVKNYKNFVQFLRDQGYPGSVNFAAFQFLVDQGYTSGHVNQRWTQFFKDLGYTGTLQEMMNQWVNNNFVGVGFTVSIGNGVFESSTLLTATVNGLVGGETVTYQWQDDGVNITGATSSTYTATIGTDSIADASDISCVITVDGGDPISSGTREIRYPAGSVTESALADWTIDDDSLNISFTSDFTTTNLTGSYVITSLPTGVIDDGDGTISGNVDGTVESPMANAFEVVFTDQYGRTITGNYTVELVYRTQAADPSVSTQNLTVDDDVVSINAAATANGNTLSYVLTTGVGNATINSSSGSITVTGNGGAFTQADVSSGNMTVTATDEYDRNTIYSVPYAIALRSQATATGGLSDQDFFNDTGDQTFDPTGDFTTGSNTITWSITSLTGVSINSSTGLITFDTDTLDIQSNTPLTVTATDEYSRTTDSSFSFDISVASSPVNPAVTGDTFNVASGGTPASFDVDGTYSGSDQINISIAFGNSMTVTNTQLKNESGGTGVDGFVTKTNLTVSSGTFNFSENIDQADFTFPGGKTATDVEGSDQIKYIVWEQNNGGETTVITAGDTPSLDLTTITLDSAEVTDVDTVRVTLSENAYGSTVAGDWTLTGNTISSASFTPGNDFVDLTVGSEITPSDDYTGDFSFSGSSLTDIGGLALASFSGEDVTNGLTAPTLSSTVPADNATDIAVDSTIDLVFDQAVTLETGNITLRDNDGGFANLEVFNVATGTGDGGGTVALATTTVTNDTVRITPGTDLANSIEHAIRVDTTAIDSSTGVSYGGIADDTTVSFTTAAASAGVNFTWVDGIDTAQTVGNSFSATGLDGGTASANRHLIIAICGVTVNESAAPDMTVRITPAGGSQSDATFITGSKAYGPTRRAVWLFYFPMPSGATFDISIETTTNLFHCTIGWGWTDDTPTFGTAVTDGVATDTSLTFDANTTTGGYVFGAISSRDDAGFSLSGVTQEEAVLIANNSGRLEEGIYFSESITTGETPRAMSASWTNSDEYAVSVVPFS